MPLKINDSTLQILALEEIKDSDLNLVGHKAFNLARLKKAGFLVPYGKVITSKSVHALHLDENPLLPEESKTTLINAYHTVNKNGKGVAVRSSAIGEDSSNFSFAGEFTTQLNVNSPDEFILAIQTVARSLHSKRVEEYSTHARLHETGMAILIQEMVYGDISGIAFSESVDKTQKNVVIVEAVKGLGDQLASGLVESDHATVSKMDFSILDQVNAGVLTPDYLKIIAKKAKEIESLFSHPQDIEFSFIGDQLWILQSRPITATGTVKRVRNEFDSYTGTKEWWSSHNAQEVLPGVICPLSCSFMERFVNKSVRYAYRAVWDNSDHFDLFGIFFQRSYINMTAMKILTERVFGTDSDEIIDQYLGQKHHKINIENPDSFLKKTKIKFLYSPKLIYQTLVSIDDNIEKVNREVDALEDYLFTMNWKDLSNSELWVELNNISKVFEKAFANHLLSGAAIGMPIKYLEKIIAPFSKENNKHDVNTLLSGLKNIVSSQITLKIWDLSRIVQKEKIVIDNSFKPFDQSLPSEWRSSFTKFINNYGHRCENEWDTQATSWRQNPAPLIQMIGAYATLNPDNSPYISLEKTAADRESLTKSLSNQMSNPRRKLFHYILNMTQKAIAKREITKNYGVKATRLMEFPLKEISLRLSQNGSIENPEDLYFLTFHELKEALMKPTAVFHLQSKIIERKREYEAIKYLELPDNFQGYPAPLPPQTHSNDNILQGYSINDKTVTGHARIIENINQGSNLKPGEILVTSTMDVALTPLFSIASGVVVDIGGMLSHGCIIAREFGLPGIINVKEGTRKIKNGDLLTIDGKNGIVIISSDEKH